VEGEEEGGCREGECGGPILESSDFLITDSESQNTTHATPAPITHLHFHPLKTSSILLRAIKSF